MAGDVPLFFLLISIPINFQVETVTKDSCEAWNASVYFRAEEIIRLLRTFARYRLLSVFNCVKVEEARSGPISEIKRSFFNEEGSLSAGDRCLQLFSFIEAFRSELKKKCQ